MTSKRVTVMCDGCGKGSRNGPTCYDCRRNGPPASDLPAGRWVRRAGGVKVWVPDVRVAPLPEPAPTSLHPHEFCPDCSALLLLDEWCPCSRAWARTAALAHSWRPLFELQLMAVAA